MTERSEGVDVALDPLVGRLRYMAKTRRETANGYRANGGYSYAPICGLESAADAYDRAADELERVLAGECSPAPGHDWPAHNALLQTPGGAHP